jgi:hypothetical protein
MENTAQEHIATEEEEAIVKNWQPMAAVSMDYIIALRTNSDTFRE